MKLSTGNNQVGLSKTLFTALGIGIIGYRFIAGLEWVDSLLNASMILGGMGPVDPLHSVGAKLFASFYALFSGLVFIGVASLPTINMGIPVRRIEAWV